MGFCLAPWWVAATAGHRVASAAIPEIGSCPDRRVIRNLTRSGVPSATGRTPQSRGKTYGNEDTAGGLARALWNAQWTPSPSDDAHFARRPCRRTWRPARLIYPSRAEAVNRPTVQ